QSQKINSFLGINISESPWDVIKSGFQGITGGTANGWLILAMIVGILIPVLAWFTQWLNYKLMPQSATNANKENAMASQLNSMNTIMPLFSAFICLTLSMGIGIYWIVGAVIRCIQQVIINRKIGKIDTEAIRQQISDDRRNALAEENRKERAKSAAKRSSGSHSFNDVRGARAKNLPSTEELLNREMKDVHPDSLTAKANMVRKLDSRTGKKK
ncbi:MAG: YidC/Oxa1 family membrane protein insertase, partial [Firmicutes bacterium]|nr:YidC/Oxa1 family membrane protein insertase [Bacillota bacterium]